MNRNGKTLLNLKNRNSTKSTAGSATFTDLVREALKVTRELNGMRTPENRKLTARALLHETLATVESSSERIAKLRAAIEGGEPGLDHSRGTLRRMIQFLRGLNWSFAPKEPRRLGFLSTDATNGELALLRNSSVELFCVAIQMAGEKHPESFGTNEDSAKYAIRAAELAERQSYLFDQIGLTLSAEDLDIGSPDSQGRAVVSFKLSGGRIPIAPQNDAGERLVKYLIANGANRI